jgi:hypothetical protein
MDDDGIFYRHLVHFTVFYSSLWTVGTVRCNLVYFSPFWYFVPRKIWQPWMALLFIRVYRLRSHLLQNFVF